MTNFPFRQLTRTPVGAAPGAVDVAADEESVDAARVSHAGLYTSPWDLPRCTPQISLEASTAHPPVTPHAGVSPSFTALNQKAVALGNGLLLTRRERWARPRTRGSYSLQGASGLYDCLQTWAEDKKEPNGAAGTGKHDRSNTTSDRAGASNP
jgi:hypothetical protein